LNQPKGNIMITTWKIAQCERLTADGFITTAHWTVNAVDGDYTASSYGTCGFAAATPAIPYASVTEQEVLDWCFASFVDKDAIEASLAANIALQKAPVTATGVPW
jgi:hypothetical protein